MAKANKGNKSGSQVDTAPVAAVETVPVAAAAEAAPATGSLPTVDAALVPNAPPKGISTRKGAGEPFVNPMPKSTVDHPVQVAWALFASLYQQHGPALTRKQAVDAAMAAGVAYYTSRTQFQLWRTALLQSATKAKAA